MSENTKITSKGGYSLEINGKDAILSDPDGVDFEIGEADLLELLDPDRVDFEEQPLEKLEIRLTLTSNMFHDSDDIPTLELEDGPFWYEGAWPEVGGIRWFFIFNRQPSSKLEAVKLVANDLEDGLEDDFDREAFIKMHTVDFEEEQSVYVVTMISAGGYDQTVSNAVESTWTNAIKVIYDNYKPEMSFDDFEKAWWDDTLNHENEFGGDIVTINKVSK